MPNPFDLKTLVQVKGHGPQKYWEREQMAGGVYLIPVIDGIPRVAEHIYVAPDQIVRVTDKSKAPGYGRSTLLTWAAE